jgi:hypothetical protein
MKSFHDFLDKKTEDNRDHLLILGKIFKKAGFGVNGHLDETDPYVFVRKPVEAEPILENLSFGGIRIYVRGKDTICYRSQVKDGVEAFGTAYILPINETFKSMSKEHEKKDKIGERIVKDMIGQVMKFFMMSFKAERDVDDNDRFGDMIAGFGSGGTDYANQAMKDDRV